MPKVTYEWALRDVLSAHNIYKTTKLRPLLAEYGIHLSESQVYRLVAERPDRMNLQVLAAICHMFKCDASDLIRVVVLSDAAQVAVGEDTNAAAASRAIRDKGLRPKQAHIPDRHRS